MTSIFYNNAGLFNGTAALPTQNFAAVKAIPTPVQTPSYVFNGNAGIFSSIVSATGFVTYAYPPSSGQFTATTYLGPTTIENSGNNCYVYTPSLNNITTQIYNFGTPTAAIEPNSYGFQASGASYEWVSVDRTHKSYYLHPGSNGQNLRTGTCTSIASSYGTSRTSYQVPTGELTGQTIYFERTFVNPPLIFVTETTGPISFHFMTKNAEGLYDGMVIVAASSPSTQGLAGTSWYTPNTYNFTYFLISDELPTYKQQAAHGVQVFNEYGTKVFDSSYFVPSFTIIPTFSQPYFKFTSGYLAPSCSYTGSGQYQGFGINQFGVADNEGVCINNWNSIKGHTVYTSLVLGSGSSASGPTTFWGHYVDIQYNPTYQQKVATVQATGTNGIYMFPTFNAPFWGNSWSYFDRTQPNVFILTKFAY
jgi:hypothetical protein